MTLPERFDRTPTVSLAKLLDGSRPPVSGDTDLDLAAYTDEILKSGFPGLRHLEGRALRAQLDGYLRRVIDRDFEELGHSVRNPAALKRWMAAYAAATSTTATFERIRDAATSGQNDKPARSTTLPYRDVLERLWILDPVPGWLPSRNQIKRLTTPPKHHLVDPALAARLLDADRESLLAGRALGPAIRRDGVLLGALFESLVTQTVRVLSQANEARIGHLRTRAGMHEVDLILEHTGGRVIGIEVKLGRTVDDHDVRHLHWLSKQLGEDLIDMIIITTGPEAYRRQDGVAVVPAALLGP